MTDALRLLAAASRAANANAADELPASAPPAYLEPLMRQIVAEEISRVLGGPVSREGMNADEVASFLGVDRKTVYEYANRGRIPHQRLGARLVFSRTALMAWLGAWTASSPKGGH